MADYSQYQEPNLEWVEFTRVTEIPAVSLGPGETPADYRRARNTLREAASKKELEAGGLLEKVSWEDTVIPTRDNSTIPVRIYKPKSLSTVATLPVYLYFHGGGYLFGSIDSEDANCSRVITLSPFPIIVVHVEYRHTPDFKHPTQHNDAWDAFVWLEKNIASLGGDHQRVIVSGLSAGGGLAASVVLRAHEQLFPGDTDLRIVGQMLLIPWLIHPKAYPFGLLTSRNRSSYSQNTHAPNLPVTQIDMYIDNFDGPDTDPADIYLSTPLAPDEKLKGIPKTVVVAAGMDPLRDEALLYADKLAKNDVPTDVHVFSGLPHGFTRYRGLQVCERWDKVIAEGLQWCLSDDDRSAIKVEPPLKETKSN